MKNLIKSDNEFISYLESLNLDLEDLGNLEGYDAGRDIKEEALQDYLTINFTGKYLTINFVEEYEKACDLIKDLQNSKISLRLEYDSRFSKQFSEFIDKLKEKNLEKLDVNLIINIVNDCEEFSLLFENIKVITSLAIKVPKESNVNEIECFKHLAKIIANNPNLQILDCSGGLYCQEMTGKFLNQIVDPLKNNKCLEILLLNSNKISNKYQNDLVEILKNAMSLRVLDISRTNIDTEGAKLIAESLKGHEKLFFVNLFQSRISKLDHKEIDELFKSLNLAFFSIDESCTMKEYHNEFISKYPKDFTSEDIKDLTGEDSEDSEDFLG